MGMPEAIAATLLPFIGNSVASNMARQSYHGLNEENLNMYYSVSTESQYRSRAIKASQVA